MKRFGDKDVSATLCRRIVRRHIVAETSVTETSRIQREAQKALPKSIESRSCYCRVNRLSYLLQKE